MTKLPARAATGFYLVLVTALVGCGNQDPDIVAGESIVNQSCKACHGSGINGAPILGNKKMWEPRAAQGLDVLVEHATQGFGLMPAKGGNTGLTETEMHQAVKYMLSRLEE